MLVRLCMTRRAGRTQTPCSHCRRSWECNPAKACLRELQGSQLELHVAKTRSSRSGRDGRASARSDVLSAPPSRSSRLTYTPVSRNSCNTMAVCEASSPTANGRDDACAGTGHRTAADRRADRTTTAVTGRSCRVRNTASLPVEWPLPLWHRPDGGHHQRCGSDCSQRPGRVRQRAPA